MELDNNLMKSFLVFVYQNMVLMVINIFYCMEQYDLTLHKTPVVAWATGSNLAAAEAPTFISCLVEAAHTVND